jgi:hypothetical protein
MSIFTVKRSAWQDKYLLKLQIQIVIIRTSLITSLNSQV